MEGGNAPSPDLQALLATLSQYTPPVYQHNGVQLPDLAQLQAHLPTASTPWAFDVERSATSTPQPAAAILPAPTPRSQDPRLRPQRRAVTASPKPPQIDPATITSWQEGLRCVTKIAAQNAHFAERIKKVS